MTDPERFIQLAEAASVPVPDDVREILADLHPFMAEALLNRLTR